MRVNEIVEKIRLESGLAGEQFNRLLMLNNDKYTGATLAQHDNQNTKLSVDILEQILDVYGYSLELKTIDNDKHLNSVNMYKSKTGEEVINMSLQEQLDYVFVSLTCDKWAKILKMSMEQINLIPIHVIKLLLKDALEKIDRKALSFIIDGKYTDFEYDLSDFIDGINYHLSNNTNISKDILDKAEYIKFKVNDYSENPFDVFFDIDNYQLLDKSGEKLPVSCEDIKGIDGRVCIDYNHHVRACMYYTNINMVKIKY